MTKKGVTKSAKKKSSKATSTQQKESKKANRFTFTFIFSAFETKHDDFKVAKAECRSIPNQIKFWAKIGKCVLDNPDMPVEFIYDILISKNQDRSLAELFIFEGKHG